MIETEEAKSIIQILLRNKDEELEKLRSEIERLNAEIVQLKTIIKENWFKQQVLKNKIDSMILMQPDG